MVKPLLSRTIGRYSLVRLFGAEANDVIPSRASSGQREEKKDEIKIHPAEARTYSDAYAAEMRLARVPVCKAARRLRGEKFVELTCVVISRTFSRGNRECVLTVNPF